MAKDKGKTSGATADAPVTEAPAEAKSAEAEAPKTADGRGKKIMLPNGEFRLGYIHRRYYIDGGAEHTVKRGDIARELSELTGKTVAYQIVFAATKTDTKPVPKVKIKPPVAEGAATEAA